MSTKYLLPLIIAILICTIFTVSVNQFNKPSNNKVAIVSSSSVVMTQSSVASSSSQVSSSSNTKSGSVVVESIIPKSTPKVVESVIAESVKPISKTAPSIPNQKCDIEEYEMILKVESDDLCFAGVNWYGDPNPNYPTTIEFANTRKPIIIDYYQRMIKLGASKKSSVNMQGYIKISDTEFDFLLTLEDFVRFQKEFPNVTEKAGPLGYHSAKYKITKNANNKWNWKLISIGDK